MIKYSKEDFIRMFKEEFGEEPKEAFLYLLTEIQEIQEIQEIAYQEGYADALKGGGVA